MRAMRRRHGALVLALAVALGGCAAVACDPVTIVVARKDERSQLRSEPRGMRTDERGRVTEIRREVITTDFWVADGEGRWYRVPESDWRATAPGQPLRVCR
jgi:hypothetical protein